MLRRCSGKLKRRRGQLPEELLTEVLLRLPVKSLLRFNCVSKLWRHIIQSPYFVSKHLLLHPNKFKVLADTGDDDFIEFDFHNLNISNRRQFPQNFEYPPCFVGNTIVGTSNGIVCLLVDFDTRVLFWNPTTNKYRHGPLLNQWPSPTPHREQYGFGYDHKTDNYKFVMLKYYYYDNTSDKDSCSIILKVYSLKSDSWGPAHVKYGLYLNSEYVFASGAMHCLAQKEKRGDFYVFAFDLATEEWGEVVRLGARIYSECPTWNFGTTLDGSLYIRYNYGDDRFDVWVMSVDKSWNQLFSIGGIGHVRFIEVIGCAESERQVLILQLGEFKLYDIEEKTFKDVVVPAEAFVIEAFSCTESLVLV